MGQELTFWNFVKNLIRQHIVSIAENGRYYGHITFRKSHMSGKILVLEIYYKKNKIGRGSLDSWGDRWGDKRGYAK